MKKRKWKKKADQGTYQEISITTRIEKSDVFRLAVAGPIREFCLQAANIGIKLKKVQYSSFLLLDKIKSKVNAMYNINKHHQLNLVTKQIYNTN